MTNEALRVLIADDHAEFRHGLDALLRSAPSMTVLGTAADGAEAVRLSAELQPDVVVMDLHMPDLNGVEATQRIVATSPHVRVLVLTMFDDDDSVFAAMRAGARGYLLKGAGRDEIIRSISAVARGEAIFGPGIAHRIAGFFAQERELPEPFPQLTDRERELLDLVATGRNNRAMAAQLFLSEKTIRNHMSNIFSKLSVAGRAEAIILARDAGLGGGTKPRWSPDDA